jgi:predicted metal-dependent hydrolase
MTIVINEKTYSVLISHRAQKRTILRFKNDVFFVSSPKKTPISWIEKQIQLHGEKLITRIKNIPASWNELGMYLLGEWVDKPKLIKTFHLHEPISMNALLKHSMVKSWFLILLSKRVKDWQKKLDIQSPYLVRVRTMSTRLGSNSRRTKRLTFALKLIHFSWPIIDAVIVHELIHDRHFDHSPRFHQALRVAYPRYDEEHAKILKGQHQ